MPSRILREGILTSERVDRLSEGAEVFYRRLMSVVDDFGRYYAHPSLLRAACYPLRLDRVPDKAVNCYVSECVKASLIVAYSVDGKQYLQVLDSRQQVRAKVSKFPQPSSECIADAQRSLSTAVQMRPYSDSDSDSDSKSNAKAGRKRPLPPGWNPKPETVEALGKEFGWKNGEVDRYVVAFTDKCKAKGYTYLDFEAAFRNCVRDDWPKLRAGGFATAVVDYSKLKD